MNYFDVWKKKMMIYGGSEMDSITVSSDDYLIRHFKESKAYRLAKLHTSDLKTRDLDVRVVNVDNTVYDKKIYLKPNEVLSQGDYIEYDDKILIVDEFEYNTESPCAKSKFCNQRLTWKGMNGVTVPCTMTNNSYGSKGLIADSEFLYSFDSRVVMAVQKNKYTDTIYEGQRIIFDHSKQDVYEITKKIGSLNTGYYHLIARYTKWMEEDDFDKNEAWNPKDENDGTQGQIYEVKGEELAKNGMEYTYEIYPSANCDWELDDLSVAEITLKHGSKCNIKIKKKDSVVLLRAKKSTGTLLASKCIYTTK